MRFKIRVTIRTELENVQIQQRVMIEFVCQFHQCPDCNREYTNRTWQALVQLRQKRDEAGVEGSRRGLAALEMALRRNKDIRKHVLSIDSCRNGLDFYFLTLPHAQQFASFLARLAPMRIKTTQKLVSEDRRNNTANIKHTMSCDMVPMCRDDLVLVQKEARGKLAGRLCLVTKVSSTIHLVDASPKRKSTMDKMELHPEQYYKAGGDKVFPIVQTPTRLIRFVVLDVELCGDSSTSADAQQYQGTLTPGVDKYALADVEVARESDMGVNDTTFTCVTHLGHLIQSGDIVLGYDLVSTHSTTSSSHGIVDVEEVVNKNFAMPDIVLVKKISAKQLEKEQELGREDDPDDEPPLQGGGTKKRVSKKKQRQRKKRDKKARELEESAARMGFLQDFAEDEEGGEAANFDDMDEDEFAKQLEEDPELAADLDAVEQELAKLEVSAEPSAESDVEVEEAVQAKEEVDFKVQS